MADFKTHVTVSSLLGVGYGAAAYAVFNIPPASCVLAASLCGVSGMLPDLDSGPGRPLRESMGFAAAVVPMMVSHRLASMGLSTEWTILAAMGLYFFIRFGVAELLRLYTVHRGMFHSIPAVIIAGELAFLLLTGDEMKLRIYKAGAVSAGYLSHLILDEIWSIQWKGGFVRLKTSFGSALKILGPSTWGNVSAGGKLVLLTAMILLDPNGLAGLHRELGSEMADVRPVNSAPLDPATQQKAPTAGVSQDSSPRTATPWYSRLMSPGRR